MLDQVKTEENITFYFKIAEGLRFQKEPEQYAKELAAILCDTEKIHIMAEDNVNYPKHYTSHPSGIECIQVTEHYDFCVGNAIKYLWRAGLKKGDAKITVEKEIEDLEKAKWYIDRKIQSLKKL
jgi:hypothetical protein